MRYEHETGESRRARVLALLRDGQWHKTAEIESAAIGGSQGTRRLRELRSPKYGEHIIEKRPVGKGSTQYEYRLREVDRTCQQDLFDFGSDEMLEVKRGHYDVGD